MIVISITCAYDAAMFVHLVWLIVHSSTDFCWDWSLFSCALIQFFCRPWMRQKMSRIYGRNLQKRWATWLTTCLVPRKQETRPEDVEIRVCYVALLLSFWNKHPPQEVLTQKCWVSSNVFLNMFFSWWCFRTKIAFIYLRRLRCH